MTTKPERAAFLSRMVMDSIKLLAELRRGDASDTAIHCATALVGTLSDEATEAWRLCKTRELEK